MIFEKDYDEDLLEEAIAFKNTHKQANRIKCATIGWNALEELISSKEGE
jgi:nitrogen fixation NifU-like protein